MRTILFSLILAFSLHLSSVSDVYASLGACDSNCMKCHTLTNDDVQKIITKFKSADAKILKIQMSPVKGLWEVSVEEKGKRGVFYVDFSKQYVIRGPIIEIDKSVNKTSARIAELNKDRKVDFSKIPLANALLFGDKNAAKKAVVFTDPDCPFCGKLHAEIKKVTEKRKDIAFYIKLFPLKQLHPDAYWKSQSIMCGNSLKLLEDNFEKKSIPKPDQKCGTKEIDETIKLAGNLGITGTPTIVMPDGTLHGGIMDADKLIKMIDSSYQKSAGAEKKGAGK